MINKNGEKSYDSDHNRYKTIIINSLIGLFFLFIFLILTLNYYAKLLQTNPVLLKDASFGTIFCISIFIFECFVIFVFGYLIGNLWHYNKNNTELFQRLIKDIIIGLLFTFFLMSLNLNVKDGWEPIYTVITFFGGLLVGEQFWGYLELDKSVRELDKTTMKMYEKVVSELMDHHLGEYISNHQDVFKGAKSVGICKEANVSFSVYEDIAFEFISNAKKSLYSTLVYPPNLLLGPKSEQYKEYFDRFACATPKDKRRIIIPDPDRIYEWKNDEKNTKENFKKFVNEWNGCHKRLVRIKVLEDYKKRPDLFYGDLLIIDEKVALTFHLHQQFGTESESLNLGTIELVCGEIVNEYLKIFKDDYFNNFLDDPENFYPEAFK